MFSYIFDFTSLFEFVKLENKVDYIQNTTTDKNTKMTIKYVNANWEEIAYSSSTTIDSNITTVYVRFV